MYICVPPNRVTLPQELINDVRTDKARCTSDLIIDPTGMRPLSFESEK